MVVEHSGRSRLLETLERLLEISSVDIHVALSEASDLVAAALRADKVDAFLYDAARDTLVARGTSNQPLSAQQRKHGLDVLPVANGGRTVDVFNTGVTFRTGRLDEDPEELRGIRDVLGVRSQIGVVLEAAGQRRGMIMIASRQPDFFTADDARFAESMARWVGLLLHRAELVEQIAANAVDQGRRAVAEELITTLAHDLRNALAPLDVRLSLLRRRAERDERSADARDLDLAQGGLARLRGMISDILDVARIDQGVLEIAAGPVDVVAMLHEVARTMAGPQQPIEVKAAEEIIAAGDPARIRQCLENLVSNAIRHSPDGAPVTIFASRQDGRAHIEVIDEGPGVAPEVLPSIFERFVSGRRKEGGLGLGLYLARRIARLHGGDLNVDSTPGKGARFILELPCWPEA